MKIDDDFSIQVTPLIDARLAVELQKNGFS